MGEVEHGGVAGDGAQSVSSSETWKVGAGRCSCRGTGLVRCLWLRSRPGPFGGDGAYVVAGSGGAWHAAKVPLHESFHVFVDDEQVLRTDHHLRVGRLRALTLHYRLSRLGTEPS